MIADLGFNGSPLLLGHGGSNGRWSRAWTASEHWIRVKIHLEVESLRLPPAYGVIK